MCEVCGSAYFSSKGLRKHERTTHPHLKPAKPKPFKLGGSAATIADKSDVAGRLAADSAADSLAAWWPS